MSESKSVCVIGGGVIGLSVAWYLQKRGYKVTVLERGSPEHDGCSLGNAGMIVPSHFVPLAAPGMVSLGIKMMANPQSPFYIRPRLSRDLIGWGLQFVKSANAAHVTRSAPLLRDLNLASRRAYEDLSTHFGGEFGLVKKGLLMLCRTEKALHEEGQTAIKAKALGIPAEVLTPEQTTQLDPNICRDIAGAVYFPQDCHLNPRRFVAGLTRDLLANGAAFRWNTEATGWRTRDTHIEAIQTQNGDLSCDEYVLAGGVWSSSLARDLHIDLPMQAGKGYSVTLQHPRQLPSICSILTEARVAVTPMGETLRVGGTMEIAGLDERINLQRVQGIINSVPAYFPKFSVDDFKDAPVWHGLRPCSPDGLPYIGRFARFTNLTAATGHAMMGLSLAPVTGQIVAALLSDETPEFDLTLLRPERFN